MLFLKRVSNEYVDRKVKKLNEVYMNIITCPVVIMMKSRRMRWAGHVTRIGAKRNACMVLVGKREGKMLLRRIRSRWVNNIKMDLREIKWGGMDWIRLAQGRGQGRVLVSAIMNLKYWDILE
jgi:hypothetical protein